MSKKPHSRPLYSEFARLYESFFGEPDMSCVRFVEATVPAPARLLDAGCGTGQYAAMFAARGYNVVAFDRSAQMLRVGQCSRPDIAFVLADLRLLPFEGRFDVVLARGVLNDLVKEDHLMAALRAVAVALDEGGKFIADVREREGHRSRISMSPVVERRTAGMAFRASRHMDDKGTVISIEQFAASDVWSSPYRFEMRTFTERGVHDLWREAGLTIVDIAPSYGVGSGLKDRLVVVARRLCGRQTG